MLSQLLDVVPPVVTNIFYIGAGVMSVAMSLVSLYVLYRAAQIVLLVTSAGVGALREDLQNRNFKRRYRLEQRRSRQFAHKRRRERAYQAWKSQQRRY